jgi:hypothetical protein
MQLMVGLALGVSGRKILPRKTNLIISGANAMGMLVAALAGGYLGSAAPGIAGAGEPPNCLAQNKSPDIATRVMTLERPSLGSC